MAYPGGYHFLDLEAGQPLKRYFYVQITKMKYPSILLALWLLGACKPTQKPLEGDTTFVLAFGSCNKPELKNHLWDDILRAKPDVWVWGGDNVYADTEDMDALAAFYSAQNAIPDYAILKAKVPVIVHGTIMIMGSMTAEGNSPKNGKANNVSLIFSMCPPRMQDGNGKVCTPNMILR